MLARFRFLIPFELSVPQGSELKPQEFELAPYRVRIYPPCRATYDAATMAAVDFALAEIWDLIVPAPVQTPGVAEVNGIPAVQTNLFQIGFLKAEFDRRRSISEVPDHDQAGDPPPALALSVLNDWIGRYKQLCRSVKSRALRLEEAFWAMEYLADDETPLPRDPELFRRRGGGRKESSVEVVDRHVWDRVGAIPFGSKPQAWEMLILDAQALLPEIGPSVVLAYAALEAFVDSCLDKLAPLAKILDTLWEWINNRESFWLRPRTDEQFDVLLKSLTGRSLKDQANLWELFKNLRSARHSYVHNGRAVIGNDELSVDRATKLVNGATEIIDWMESLLPELLRRKQLGLTFSIAFKVAIPIARVAIVETPSSLPPPDSEGKTPET